MADGGFEYGGITILSHPIFVEAILPFLLVFTIMFAVLQKTEILGKGKKQVDAITSLVVGLLVISFGNAVGIIVRLIPFLAVTLVILLVFLILLGSFHKEGEFKLHASIKILLTIIISVALVIAVLLITGAWDSIYGFIYVNSTSGVLINVVFLIVVVGAIVAVILGAKGSSSKTPEKT
jgi:hypothetical protein